MPPPPELSQVSSFPNPGPVALLDPALSVVAEPAAASHAQDMAKVAQPTEMVASVLATI